ncbi:hypothetical protein CLI64_24020 [Nostoc sp. CENA543]|uniref:hypothetical protein n=1 Tax=Nostoc sp. CENA543 TaxID=1869241 RepID=UPI000CA2D86B|nr:hypothetical protein [Nostoc sp. CENA543]AUT03231.1 hypothetical protein CLI64_24020 [Nostoc sp. CENA543]
MTYEQQDYCFCTLALRKKYRQLTQQLAGELAKYAPGKMFVVLTDQPADFQDYANVLAFKHNQRGILHCYHDKSLVMELALAKFTAAIYIDADTTILSPLPENLHWKPGITAGHCENLVAHVTRYTPERLPHIRKVAAHLNITLEDAPYIGESLFMIARDEGREIEYLKYWAKIGRYLELRGIHAGSGNAMGLAAAKVGWDVSREGWSEVRNITKHLDASYTNKQSVWDLWKRKLGYHYRLNKARLTALTDFQFFYR